MLPPVLEIHVVWHPDDEEKARPIAEAIIDHYHGDQFSGLIGGAVEVFVRSAGWAGAGSPPRLIQLPDDAGPPRPAAYVAVVALLDLGLADATKDGGEWFDWLLRLKTEADAKPAKVRLWGMSLHKDAPNSAGLKQLFANWQLLASPDSLYEAEDTMRFRDLSQSLAQFLKGDKTPIQVFISHTKHMDKLTEQATKAFIEAVRHEVQKTKLKEFFDSSSIQVGDDWSEELKANAGTGAMLCLRTDSYAGREWCHREVATAKTKGVPVVAIDALMHGDGRGSFLLDHIPRVPAKRDGEGWDRATIRNALLRLVDECLKRELWKRQEDLAPKKVSKVNWWAPHAPEPLTFAHWLEANKPKGKKPVVVLHPDPPLTECERQAINAVAGLAGIGDRLEILTPRTLSARAGALTKTKAGS
ncbi:MAG: toll/interleukin-1 receptor domain-containing protein [Magnetospirillum sp.]|nr:toll/interleukin-1 receptor domain-containing protein [Magnetospirillum sp.]